MKMMKTLFAVLLLAVLCAALPLNALAAETKQLGIKAELTTQKQSYQAGETVHAVLKVTNTAGVHIEGMALETLLPEGCVLSDESKSSATIDIMNGETVELEMNFIAGGDVVLPDSGDDSSLMLWAVLFAAGGVLLVYLGRKNAKGMTALLLCAALLGGSVAVAPVEASAAAGYAPENCFSVTHTFTINGERVSLTATVMCPASMFNDVGMRLWADRKAAIIGSDDMVHMYLETNLTVGEISLWYGEAGDKSRSAVLKDNGMGIDEIAGDGIYTAWIDPDLAGNANVIFTAKCGTKSSNDVGVDYYTPISANSRKTMDTVSGTLGKLISTDSFDALPEEEKLDLVLAAIDEFGEFGMIDRSSVKIDAERGVVMFSYNDGILGGVMYGEFEDDKNGAAPARSEAPGSRDYYTVSKPRAGAPEQRNTATNASTIGKAIILNSFPVGETDPDDIAFRTEFYEDLKAEWDGMNLATTLIVDPTVANYKTISSYDVVCIASHGSGRVSYNGVQTPMICLEENATTSKDTAYQTELKDGQIAKLSFTDGSTKYWIMPRFFSQQFGSNELDGTFIYSECCENLGYGKGSATSSYNTAMPSACISRSADAYIGFHNSVFAVYSRELMRTYFNGLISGMTSLQAYNAARSEWGDDHADWFAMEYGMSYKTYCEYYYGSYDALVDVAYPVLYGDTSAVLVSSSKNLSFEEYSSSTTAPTSWDILGDVRTVAQLGSITPRDGVRMAIITTGVGSKTSAVLSTGTEGSRISQTISIPSGATTLSFNYDFVSEEPMEFVGSIYNDSVAVQISQGSTTSYTSTLETVNTASWTSISNVDFAGGDHTTFHTGWKTKTINVSAYAGKSVTLSFTIYDVGDSIYDSACVLDNIVIK